jgi:hypothetical protein
VSSLYYNVFSPNYNLVANKKSYESQLPLAGAFTPVKTSRTPVTGCGSFGLAEFFAIAGFRIHTNEGFSVECLLLTRETGRVVRLSHADRRRVTINE